MTDQEDNNLQDGKKEGAHDITQRVLLVDDEEDLVDSLIEVFEERGYQADGVYSGRDAIEKVKESFYDLILLDIRMPDLDGIETLEKIRKIQDDSGKSSVIILTGYSSEEAAIEAVKLGVDDYLTKPFELDNLIQHAEKTLKIKRLQREKEQYVNKLQKMEKKMEKFQKQYENLYSSYMKIMDSLDEEE